MGKTIKATHENGYSGVLYGNSSMSIYYNGREVLHTGFRTIETKEELMEELENMPNFVAMLEKISEEYRNE